MVLARPADKSTMIRSFLKHLPSALIFLAASLYTTPAEKLTLLESVRQNNRLVVVTRSAASTYYRDATGPAGPEFDLARRFAERLDVDLKIIVASDLKQIFSLLARGEAHFAAAGLTQTADRYRWLRFTPPYQYVVQQLVYRQGTHRPRNISDLGDGKLLVVAGSSHIERLRQLQKSHPRLTWEESLKFGSNELLKKVETGEIDYTVVDSNELRLTHRFYPHVRVAFDISEFQPISWAFPVEGDDSLYQEAVGFFVDIYNNGILEQILERYYGHIGEFDYVATTTFITHIRQRLPRYRHLFERAAKEFDIDWRLLAAVSYQESHWNPKAVSPTGVRGIMMLTRITAKQLGIRKRTNPEQSIHGGARYLSHLKQRLPTEISGPDRNWFALAAYNIGYGHLMDAREITRKTGGNPNLWMDVKKKLPLLRDKKWYRKTVYGYARGDEAAFYVENIRNYYQILQKETGSILGMATGVE